MDAINLLAGILAVVVIGILIVDHIAKKRTRHQ